MIEAYLRWVNCPLPTEVQNIHYEIPTIHEKWKHYTGNRERRIAFSNKRVRVGSSKERDAAWLEYVRQRDLRYN